MLGLASPFLAVGSSSASAGSAVAPSLAGVHAKAKRAAIPKRFPRAANTGASGRLRTIKGRTITRNGRVIRNAIITGQVTIKARNVRLVNVHVRTRDTYGIVTYGRRTRVIDSTVTGTPGETLAGIAAYEQGTVIARRVDVSRSEDGVRLADNSVLEDSFIHHLGGHSSSHFDAVTADGYRGWRIEHNTILNRHGQTAAVWIGDDRHAPSEGILTRNYLAGGGYSIYSGPGIGKGLRVTRNRFSTRFYARSGYWGPVYEWTRSGNLWKRNKWRDGPRKGKPVKP